MPSHNHPLRAETRERIIAEQQTSTVLPWLDRFAMTVAAKYQAAVTLTTSGKSHLVTRGEMLCREYERQLILLAAYADEIL